jgi:uncharacterized membrane protein
MATMAQGPENSGRKSNRLATRILFVWALIVSAFFLWQTIFYRGIPGRLAEWQYARIDTYYPTLTLLALIALFTLPFLALIALRRRLSTSKVELSSRSKAIAAGRPFLRILYGLSAASFLAALVTLLLMFRLPAEGGSVQQIKLSDRYDATPNEGATNLIGAIDYRHVAKLEENMGPIKRDTHFAPILPIGGKPTQIEFFVELTPSRDNPGSFMAVGAGILRRDSLPGELVSLYRNSGYAVGRPHYVLHKSVETMQWPFVVVAVQYAIIGLILLIVALLYRRHRNRMKEKLSEVSREA